MDNVILPRAQVSLHISVVTLHVSKTLAVLALQRAS
jgi:hypothetical protein